MMKICVNEPEKSGKTKKLFSHTEDAALCAETGKSTELVGGARLD